MNTVLVLSQLKQVTFVAVPCMAALLGSFESKQMSAMGLPLRLPNEAHHTLYVEGIPSDASEREMAHIFRPFPGYISLRLRAKGGRGMGPSSFNSDAICFVEFESAYHVSLLLTHS